MWGVTKGGSPAQIPGPGKRPWWLSKKAHVCMAAVGPAVATIVICLKADAAYASSAASIEHARLAQQIDKLATMAASAVESSHAWTFWPAAGALVWLLFSTAFLLYSAHRDDRKTVREQSPLMLQGPLVMLLEAITRRHNLSSSETDAELFRATIYRNIDGEHEQVVPYVGWSSGDVKRQPGRRWNNSKGLVGKAIRLGGKAATPAVVRADVDAEVTTKEQFVQALVRNYGFTEEEASHLAPMRVSSLVITITDGHQVIGAIYCDSSKRDFFDEDITVLAVSASKAIANLVALM
jgi:GAF domain-containing protein